MPGTKEGSVKPSAPGHERTRSVAKLEVFVLGALGSGAHVWNPCPRACQRLGGWRCRPSPGQVAG